MSEAARMAPQLAGPAWILALEQTGGRGRRGRAWQMPAGNFAATLVFRPDADAATAALYSFVAALALHDALAHVAGTRADLRIKWPNDVLVNGGKIAGILLESRSEGAGIGALAIGIGVNLIAAPDRGTVETGAVPPVSLLGETGLAVTPEAFLTPLAAAFAARARSFRDYGFAPVRRAWLERAARIGEPVIARTGHEVSEGIFETIDDSGAMILRTEAGRKAIAAADIFF